MIFFKNVLFLISISAYITIFPMLEFDSKKSAFKKSHLQESFIPSLSALAINAYYQNLCKLTRSRGKDQKKYSDKPHSKKDAHNNTQSKYWKKLLDHLIQHNTSIEYLVEIASRYYAMSKENRLKEKLTFSSDETNWILLFPLLRAQQLCIRAQNEKYKNYPTLLCPDILDNSINEYNKSNKQISIMTILQKNYNSLFIDKQPLVFTKNQLQALPNLSTLKELTITNTSLKTISTQMTNLKILDLSSNHIKNIPKEINNLSNLKELYLESNYIAHIPDTIGSLTKLTILFLNNNKIKSVPRSLNNCTNLESLRLDNNRIKKTPVDSLCNLTLQLNLRNNDMHTLDSHIKKCSHLQGLILSFNPIKNLAEELFDLTQLKSLSLSGIPLRNLSSSIGNLTNLTNLAIESAQLTELPTEIQNCTNLTHLNIRNNNIDDIEIKMIATGLQRAGTHKECRIEK